MPQKLKLLLILIATFTIHISVVRSEEISDAELERVLQDLLLNSLYKEYNNSNGDSRFTFFQLSEDNMCPVFVREGQKQRNFCDEGYLNLCEFDELKTYLDAHRNIVEEFPMEASLYNKNPWDLSEIEALQLMNKCVSGDADACIISADYVSSYLGHEEARISGCALQKFERNDQRKIQQVNWLLEGVKLGSADALQQFISATEYGGLKDYVDEADFKVKRQAQINILENLRSVAPENKEFTSRLENGLGNAYAYVGQFLKSYMSHTVACDLRNARSCFELGHQASHGYGFIPKNHMEAIQYFDAAIELGDKSSDPYMEKFLIYTDPDSPIFDLQKAASAVESCPKYSKHCKDYLLSLVAYLGEPINSWESFDDIVMATEYKRDYVDQRVFDYPIMGPSDFSDSHYVSNTFWFLSPSRYYLGPMLRQCYARNADACLLLSYLFSDQIWSDTGLSGMDLEKIKRRSIIYLLPKPNKPLSYKYLLMVELSKLSEQYRNRYYDVKRVLENGLPAKEKVRVQRSATSAKLWAFED